MDKPSSLRSFLLFTPVASCPPPSPQATASRVQHCSPMDCGPPGSSVHGISQARMVEWVAIFFSRGSSRPRDQTQGFCIAGGFFTAEPPGKHLLLLSTVIFRFIYVVYGWSSCVYPYICYVYPFSITGYISSVFYSWSVFHCMDTP